MKRRRLILVVLLLVVLLLGAFVVYGIPLIQAMFTPPITGLPTTSAGNSLQARYTQTALAKTSAPNASATAQPAPK
jgi:hypothetical protein